MEDPEIALSFDNRPFGISEMIGLWYPRYFVILLIHHHYIVARPSARRTPFGRGRTLESEAPQCAVFTRGAHGDSPIATPKIERDRYERTWRLVQRNIAGRTVRVTVIGSRAFVTSSGWVVL